MSAFSKAAMRDAAIEAHKAGVKVSLTLSDAFCVARFRDEFVELVQFFAGEISPGLQSFDYPSSLEGL